MSNMTNTAHQVRVSAAPRMLGQRRTLFYAICACGWTGQSRSTHERAEREGRCHEDGILACPDCGSSNCRQVCEQRVDGVD